MTDRINQPVAGGLRNDIDGILSDFEEDGKVGCYPGRKYYLNRILALLPPVPDTVEPESEGVKDVFTAGAIAGGTAARMYESGDEWREWLKAEVARRYPTRPATKEETK